ncbi:hypothetical protein ACN5ZK_00050 [Macrococcoides bohemicum]
MKLQSVMLYAKEQAQAVKFWTEVMQFEINFSDFEGNYFALTQKH